MNNMLFKGTGIIDPKIIYEKIDNNENLLIVDSDMSYINTFYKYLKGHGYEVKILNLRDTEKSHSWNLLDYPYQLYSDKKQDKCLELLESITKAIDFDNNSSNDPFWYMTAAELVKGIIFGLFEDADYNEINLKSVWNILEGDNERFLNSDKLTNYFKTKPKMHPSYMSASTTINAPTETKSSIIAVAKYKISPLATKENLQSILVGNEINIQDFKKEKKAVFILPHPIAGLYTSLVSIFINQLYTYLQNVDYPKCNIIISNLSHLGFMFNFDAMLENTQNNIGFLVNIESEERYMANYSYNAELLNRYEIISTIDYVITSAEIDYPTTNKKEIPVFDLDKYFEKCGIKNEVYPDVNDIIRQIDNTLLEIDNK